ncbi:hypothetical protein J5N97_028945 [Dioscorea zingiberensis]|uniref:Protein odr-4 homolog n=1 Tax=Dioscorea zingiberensis TaxID=325984 RepID=A0A9D5BZY2_9LILI|nr:hypothetical protein J5N97_028945 [Dioscorea zingiberensis]
MVKSAVGDESRLRFAEDRLFQSGAPAETGLIIGKLSSVSDRGLIFDLIPTPPTDSGGPACTLRSEGGGREDKKKGSKGGKSSSDPTPSLVIDGDWVAEHARQVSRMLLGGMYVIGAYVWASEASFKATSQTILSQTIRGIAQAVSKVESDSDEMLLIHISYSPRRWACLKGTHASGSLRPCDFKMTKLITSLQTFRCMYNFEMRIPVSQSEALRSDIKNVLRKRIASLAKEFRGAKALIDGHLWTGNQLSISEDPHTVELLLPFKDGASSEASSSEDIVGLILFSGAIFASAYLGPKEPISQAISDLQGDIINSLRSRLDIISDEAEGNSNLMASSGREEASSEISAEKPFHRLMLHELRNPYCLSFPKRVLVPWLADACICDYLQPSETFEDLKERCKEMMSMETPIDTSALIEPETEAISIAAKSFWDAIQGDSASIVHKSNSREHASRNEGTGMKTSFISFPVAVIILLLALLIGLAIKFL